MADVFVSKLYLHEERLSRVHTRAVDRRRESAKRETIMRKPTSGEKAEPYARDPNEGNRTGAQVAETPPSLHYVDVKNGTKC